MKIRRTSRISPRVIKRWKLICGLASIMIATSYFSDRAMSDIMNFDMDNFEESALSAYFVSADEAEVATTAETTKMLYANGYIELNAGVRYGKDTCDANVLIPGIQLLNNTFLVIVYLVALGYLFLGIAIISDIFMEAIEEITAQTKSVELWDNDGKVKCYIDIPVWNATVANLSLMALGSSAPEILLSVIGTVQDLEAIPSKLGPSTIVGSAAFNLLIISALSIIAVDEEPKKIFDVGVFAVTSIFSLFAYIWLFLTLSEFSAGVIETWEAWLTLVFCFLLIIFSYSADRINSFFEEKKKS